MMGNTSSKSTDTTPRDTDQEKYSSVPQPLRSSFASAIPAVADEEDGKADEVVDADPHELEGHLFAALTDLRGLVVDAWIVPSGPDFVPGAIWFRSGESATQWVHNYDQHVPSGLKSWARPQWWPSEPYPYIFDAAVRGDRLMGVDHPLIKGVAHLVHHIAMDLGTTARTGEDEQRRCGVCHNVRQAAPTYDYQSPRRAMPLIALPVVGTGLAGGRSSFGEVIHALVVTLSQCARDYGVDVCLATIEPVAFTAIQSLRAKLTLQSFEHQLGASLMREAEALSRKKALCLFIGAGVSMACGLPSWGSLLSQLAERAGITDAEDLEALWKLNHLDIAKLLEQRLGCGPDSLANVIADMLRIERWALGHALLAALPVQEVVTTNYDTAFESASLAASKPVKTLPYEPAVADERWILKLHGCVNHPEDIVLTREHYLRFGTRRAALAALCQAQLLTKHMLFVGFSLSDDNVHNIVDSVRRASESYRGSNASASCGDPHVFGTALFLSEGRFMRELWQRDLNIVSMQSASCVTGEVGPPPPDVSGTLVHARRLDCFIDFLALRSTVSSSHLLIPEFGTLLSMNEKLFRDHLLSFLVSVPADAKGTEAYRLFLKSLQDVFARNMGDRMRTSIDSWYLECVQSTDS